MKKTWIKVAIAAAALILVVAIIPLFINADTLRPTVESQLSNSLGRKVTLGHLGFSLFTGSLVAEDISIADDPAISSTPFLAAERLHIGVELWPFLAHRSVQITDITIESPSIHIIRAQNGTWNFSSLGNTASSASQGSATPPSLSVGQLSIKHGSATLTSFAGPSKPIACNDINVTIDKFSFTQPFPFKLSLELPANGSLKLDGAAGPVSQTDASKTPFQAKLDLKHFDPVAVGLVQPADGISMVADFSAQIASDGGNLTSNGTIVASQLKLARNGSPAQRPVNLDYSISDNLATRQGQVNDLTVHTGPVAAHVNGTFGMTEQGAVLDLHLAAPNLPIDAIEHLLPAAGITLPSGSSLHGGTLNANLAVQGPANAITISGPVEVDDTQLAGFDLGSRIEGLNPLAGTHGGTKIDKLSTTLNSSPQITRFDNIYASVPSIGTASGSGTVSADGALDFQLTAKFSSSSALGAVANGGLNAVGVALGGNAKMADKGIPLTITGTTSNPSIKANVGSMLKQQVSGGLLGHIAGQQTGSTAGKLKSLLGR